MTSRVGAAEVRSHDDEKGAGMRKSGALVEKILKTAITKDDEKYLYFVDKRCNIVRMARGVAKAPCEVLVETGLKRAKGYMYYVDDDGDLVREPDSARE
jgi:hypothetical protein